MAKTALLRGLVIILALLFGAAFLAGSMQFKDRHWAPPVPSLVLAGLCFVIAFMAARAKR